MWAATIFVFEDSESRKFQSTLPGWAATIIGERKYQNWLNFNPRCPCGQRRYKRRLVLRLCYFNPRCPCGQRRCICNSVLFIMFISIHAARVGSDLKSFQSLASLLISIHAARVGSDRFTLIAKVIIFCISIHAARVGSD